VDLGSFSSGLLTGLREGVEAALLVSIVLAYLAKTGNRRFFSSIAVGVAAAVGLSALAGVVLFVTVGGFEEPYEQLFEGIVMLAAAAVVTWMLFWMRRQASGLKSELHERIDRALSAGTVAALTLLAFTAVSREGSETSLFLVGQASAARTAEAGAASVLLGALAGLGIAVVLGVGFYKGTRRINLASFFRWTGVALIFIAAGLLSHAVHEFIEVAEYAGVALPATQPAFDLSAVLPHEEIDGAPGGIVLVVGQLLNALFGYTSRPEVLTLLTHVAYLAIVLVLYIRPTAPRAPRATGMEAARP